VYFTIPAGDRKRLIANLHGMCNPPGYACGYWTGAAKAQGFLVCPTGNGSCGGAYNPPTWSEDDAAVDRDLEASIAAVNAAYPHEMDRDGAILTGFSRGAYIAPTLAAMHPGRWPYLILTEANVSLDAKRLRAAKVRAVALIAGEWGTELSGERATVKQLRAAGFPAELFVMPKAGHYYSANIDDIMQRAITFVTEAPAPEG
jgi:predicted esterase